MFAILKMFTELGGARVRCGEVGGDMEIKLLDDVKGSKRSGNLSSCRI